MRLASSKAFGMRELERRRIVELGRLVLDRRHDRIAVVAGIAAPHAGRAVDHGLAVDRVVMHVLRARDQPRRLLEGAVGRERHPERFEIVGPRIGARRGWDIGTSGGNGRWLAGRPKAYPAARRLPMADCAMLIRAMRSAVGWVERSETHRRPLGLATLA